MNAFSLRAYGRILWREAAEQYALCVGVFALLVTLQASWVTMEAFHMADSPNAANGYCMALFMTAIYAAASSALLLSAEVDAGTFGFQRTKPLGWLTYLSGKMSWTVLSSLLLGLAVWIETAVWLGMFPSARDSWFALGVSGAGILEGIAWGLIASMLLREPLRAVVAGIALASLGAWLTVNVHHSSTGGGAAFVTTAYYEAAGPRLIVAAVVLVIGFPLARVWYRTGQPLRLLALPWSFVVKARTDAVADWDAVGEPCRGRTVRLLWHAWRQIQLTVLLYWGVCIAIVVGAVLSYGTRNEDPRSISESESLPCLAIFLFSSLLASYTFGADQKASFLQLARDGVSPREIWWSRLAVMTAVLLPAAVGTWIYYEVILAGEGDSARFLAILFVSVVYPSVLVVGQACSMFFRSRVLAVVATPVMTGCAVYFFSAVLFWAGLGWKLVVAPTLVALLIATRLLVATRLRQNNSWRAMRLPGSLVVAGIVVTYLAMGYQRVNEIRPYDSTTQVDDLYLVPLPPQTILSLGESRTVLSTHGFDALLNSETSPQTIISVAEKFAKDTGKKPSARECMKLALNTERSDLPMRLTAELIAHPWQENSNTAYVPQQNGVVGSYCDMLLVDAALNRALRRIAREPGIANERIRAYVEFLETWANQRSGLREWLAADYRRDLSWLQYGPAESPYRGYGFHEGPVPWYYRWLAFERKRTFKLLDRAFRISVDRFSEYESAVINDQFTDSLSWFGLVTSSDIIPPDPTQPEWLQTSRPPVIGYRHHNLFLLNTLSDLHWRRYQPTRGGWGTGDALYSAEGQRRGTILYLALRMYHNDHNKLPETLEALVEEEYLDRLPVVPIARKPFQYETNAAMATDNRSTNEPEEACDTVLPWDPTINQEHNPSLPYLWYPLGPDGEMKPGTGLGVYIDLDFVE